MNLKQAQYIKMIAQCGSITAAAKKLYVSQPSLSQMLRQIEQEIGLTLFDRSMSPLRLSYAGEKYLQAAEKMLVVNRELENQLQEIRQEEAGRLRLGISITRAMQVLPQVIPEFVERYPNVHLELTETGSGTLEKLLQEGKIDLAMAALEAAGTNISYELIEQETMGILAGRDTAVAQRLTSGTPVTLREFREERFVVLTPAHSARIAQDKLFGQADFVPHILLETDILEVGRRVALDAGACMLLPNTYIDGFVRQKKGSFFPLADYENKRHFYACRRKDEFMPRYTRDFIQITADFLKKEASRDPEFR